MARLHPVFLPLISLSFSAFACSGSDRGDDAGTQGSDFASEETRQCIGAHPASEPFDVGDVETAAPAPVSSEAMSGQAPPSAPTLETITGECRAENGTGCAEAMISREAARCIAETERFEPGLEVWTIALTYHHSYHRVVWRVENLLEDRGGGSYSGKSLTIDAVSGAVLGRTGWSATP